MRGNSGRFAAVKVVPLEIAIKQIAEGLETRYIDISPPE